MPTMLREDFDNVAEMMIVRFLLLEEEQRNYY
jgi:hypothetical protein